MTEELQGLLAGAGFVYHNPDTGEEYAPSHPIESGEVPDATRVRRSTGQEDHLYATYQTEWRRAEALRASLTAKDAEIARLKQGILDIASEAERENGHWVHLKRVIGIHARALHQNPESKA